MSHLRLLIAGTAAVLASITIVILAVLFSTKPETVSPSTPETNVAREATEAPTEAVDDLVASVATATTTTKKLAPATTSAVSVPKPSQQLALALGNLRDALVNIVCISKDPSVRSISGSGVIISPDGLILTDAHIAQLFLLKDYPRTNNVSCIIRTGSPAKSQYTASLAYISKAWLTANPTVLIDTHPKGTGQYDVALLAITDTVTTGLLPKTFAYVPLGDQYALPKQQVAIGAYPAQTLTGAQVRSSLYPTLVFSSVEKIYTFTKDSIDLLDFNGSAVAQEGSSGGGVVNELGNLVALITTSTITGDLFNRSLHAITVHHIEDTFEQDMGMSLQEARETQTPAEMAENFKTRANELSVFLQSHLGTK